MKNLKCSLPMKITAVILSYVMALVLVLSTVAIAFMGYFNFYFNSQETLQKEILGEMAMGECHTLASLDELERNLGYYYEDRNLFYMIEESDGKLVESNYKGEKIITAEQFYNEDYIYTIYVAEEMTKTDEFSFINQLIILGYKLRYAVIFFVIVSLIAFIVLLCYLYCSAGHRDAYSYIKLNALDKIPFDIYTAVVAVLVYFGLTVTLDIFYEGLEGIIVLFFGCTALYFLALGFTLTFATRVKTGTLFKNTIIYKVIKFLWRGIKKCAKFAFFHLKRLPLVWQVVLEVVAVLFFESIFLCFNLYQAENLVLGFVIINFLLLVSVLYVTITLQRIKKGGEKIASGELDYKINTDYMILDFKEFSEKLNSINDGLQSAVNEKMKSERFKTELITNVSHDIKTPLTSIINYVDLLKKEKIENETAKDYIAVLDRHSVRLKKLIEDLVEASKASTGNLSVNFDRCDLGVLLQQAVGEFDERMRKAEIIPLLKLPRENVIIKADARHLWRVFQNLLSNICKYSQSGTRAYIEASIKNGKAVVVFRNISKYELNISEDELMERFVRADASRNTEGSGLGLSIAKSLTELQNGDLKIETDGDLFKATVEFAIFEG
ncbi:MAG: sensor histidine kinase [Clostridia bacterium]|nr:sensor histidine kinase [Clostridia bacterium]